jgi:hypothetical protein
VQATAGALVVEKKKTAVTSWRRGESVVSHYPKTDGSAISGETRANMRGVHLT